MGKEKQATTTVVNQQTERQPTAEETRRNQLEINMLEQTQPQQLKMQLAGLGLGTALLEGKEPLPGYLNQLSQGISPEVTSDIVRQSLRDISPSFQTAGIMDSGVAASISARTAGDIRRASEEFNIGNRLNMLNLALSGQAQVQSPILSQASNLGARLTTLGKTTMSGNTNVTTKSMNPFLKSFETSLGSSLGSGNFGSAWKPY